MNEENDTYIDTTGYTDVTKLETLLACFVSIEESLLMLPEELYDDDLANALVKSRDQSTKKIREEMEALGLRSHEFMNGTAQIVCDRLIINHAS